MIIPNKKDEMTRFENCETDQNSISMRDEDTFLRLSFSIENILAKFYRKAIWASLVVIFAFSLGFWSIAYQSSKEQARRLSAHEKRMADLAKNLEDLRSENIAYIQLISNTLDAMIDKIIDTRHESLQNSLPSNRNERIIIRTPIDDLIENSIDATVNPNVDNADPLIDYHIDKTNNSNPEK